MSYCYTSKYYFCSECLESIYVESFLVSFGCLLQILRILKTNHWLRYFLQKKMDHIDVVGYSNIDWASSKNDRKSTSKYCTFVVIWLQEEVISKLLLEGLVQRCTTKRLILLVNLYGQKIS